MSLKDKKIIIAVSGSIAAYKTPHLVRLLVKAGAEVKVVMTQSATDFVTPLSLATVSKNEVYSNIHSGSQWHHHVDLGLWADAMLIAPCSANTLAKMANGLCDNMLLAVYLSARCPVWVAPAMDADMWAHPTTQANVAQITKHGCKLIPVGHGELASGLIGDGRMAEPEDIVALLETHFAPYLPLKGKRVMVTAGPTYERIDPVRFIGNFSTGKMGIAIADSLAEAGAEVLLVLGPTHLSATQTNITTIRVESAHQMYDVAIDGFARSNIAIMAAAVADYMPSSVAKQKIKKADNSLSIDLSRTPDILKELGKLKQPHQLLIGFALETENEIANAQSKLSNKNADMIVLNSLNDPNAGFGHDTNKVTFILPNQRIEELPLASKKEVAQAIINKIIILQHEN